MYAKKKFVENYNAVNFQGTIKRIAILGRQLSNSTGWCTSFNSGAPDNFICNDCHGNQCGK
jgi:hypothetical protein